MAVRTICVSGRTALQAAKTALARSGHGNGVAVLPIEAIAQRLAGGFFRLPQEEEVLGAIERILERADPALLDDIAEISDLPGVRSTLGGTIWKAWRGEIGLAAKSDRHPRLETLARIEASIRDELPPGVLLPAEIVVQAMSRMSHAPKLLGEVTILRQADIAPCWRPLLIALSAFIPVIWDAGHQTLPGWLGRSGLKVVQAMPGKPEVSTFSCANARHEVVEAMRWARRLIASGRVKPQEIAFASASTQSFDDFIQAAADESLLPVHFAHGRAALETPDGQTAAALADILLRGLSQQRVRRLVARLSGKGGSMAELPPGWASSLPRGAPLDTLDRWAVALEAEELAEPRKLLSELIADLSKGTDGAAACGRWLPRTVRSLWERALERAPAAALERELRLLRMPDETDPEAAIAWMASSTLAACPRPHVWLLGLNSGNWPRMAAEDPFLPNRILAAAADDELAFALQEATVTEADRRSFAAIMRSDTRTVARSFSRREATGRLLGESPLLDGAQAVHLQRTRIPEHAMSEPDRLMARPMDFAATDVALSAAACWADWSKRDITPHDGLLSRSDHPALMAALSTPQSASSLTMLLRNPLGWMWRHALGMRAAEDEAPTFELDGRQFGNLVHDIHDKAVLILTAEGGSALVSPAAIRGAAAAAALAVAADWESRHTLPPTPLWKAKLAEAGRMATNGLLDPAEGMAGARSYSEVPFGRGAPDSSLPWDPSQRVTVPGTDLWLQGRMDRLDVLANPPTARVLDFKTGSPRTGIVLQGGRELQRCLYRYAVNALLGSSYRVDAALYYPSRELIPDHASPGSYGIAERMEDPDAALTTLTAALKNAVSAVRGGLTIPGVAAGSRQGDDKKGGNAQYEVDDLAFALPVVPGPTLEPKKLAAITLLGPELTAFWEEV